MSRTLETMGERMRRIRIREELTQAAVAQMLSVDRATVSTWETDRRVPSLQAGWRFARAFGWTVERLIAGTFLELRESMPRRAGHYRRGRKALRRVKLKVPIVREAAARKSSRAS